MTALRYLMSRPPDEARTDAPPLLCFLHGYDEAAPLPIERALTGHGPLNSSASVLARERFVVVAPQLPRAGDVWHRHAADVDEVIAAARSSSGADATRTYLTGFSFGGNGVFDLALRAPLTWAALWPVDPTRVPPRDPGLPTWLSVGQAARSIARGLARTLGLRPVSTAGGDIPPEADRLYLDEGLDHTGSAASAYADDRIYSWLLRHSAEPSRVG